MNVGTASIHDQSNSGYCKRRGSAGSRSSYTYYICKSYCTKKRIRYKSRGEQNLYSIKGRVTSPIFDFRLGRREPIRKVNNIAGNAMLHETLSDDNYLNRQSQDSPFKAQWKGETGPVNVSDKVQPSCSHSCSCVCSWSCSRYPCGKKRLACQRKIFMDVAAFDALVRHVIAASPHRPEI